MIANWTYQDIVQHPCFELSLKQLRAERKKIGAFNNRIRKPGYKYAHTVKPNTLEGIDRIIKAKESNEKQLEIWQQK